MSCIYYILLSVCTVLGPITCTCADVSSVRSRAVRGGVYVARSI